MLDPSVFRLEVPSITTNLPLTLNQDPMNRSYTSYPVSETLPDPTPYWSSGVPERAGSSTWNMKAALEPTGTEADIETGGRSVAEVQAAFRAKQVRGICDTKKERGGDREGVAQK